MKVLIVHNEYARPGGEETAVQNEVAALEKRGHEVSTYIVSNQSIKGVLGSLKSGLSNIFSFNSMNEMRMIIKQSKPDIVHVHNFFPRISPSVFYACQREKVACIHTLHNYRILCPSTILFHKGDIYWQGIRRNYFNVILDAVYRNSRLATAAVVLSILVHRMLGTWRKVDRLIALSEFQKNIFEQATKAHIEVLPHFSCLPSKPFNTRSSESNYHVFAGRLSYEKGIVQLLEHWPKSEQLFILGDGPLTHHIQDKCNTHDNITWLGQLGRDQLLETMSNATSVVVPSVLHETFGLVIIESLSVGTPVLVNNMAPFRELINPGETGIVFELDSKESVQRGILEVKNLGVGTRKNCLKQFNEQYSENVGVKKLEKLMEKVIEEKRMLLDSNAPSLS